MYPSPPTPLPFQGRGVPCALTQSQKKTPRQRRFFALFVCFVDNQMPLRFIRENPCSSVAQKHPSSVARTPTATNPYTCRPIDSHTRSLTIAAHCLSLQQQRNVIQPAQPLIRVHSWFKIRFLPVATPDHSPTVTHPLCSI